MVYVRVQLADQELLLPKLSMTLTKSLVLSPHLVLIGLETVYDSVQLPLELVGKIQDRVCEQGFSLVSSLLSSIANLDSQSFLEGLQPC